MNEITITVGMREDTKRRFVASMNGEKQGFVVNFPSVELAWKVLTEKRLQIIKAMTGEGSLAIREIARRVGRDYKGVHTDVHALISAGIVERTEVGVEFPYDAVHIDIQWRAPVAA